MAAYLVGDCEIPMRLQDFTTARFNFIFNVCPQVKQQMARYFN